MTKEKIIEILEGAKDWNGDVPFDIAVKAINKMAENIPRWIPDSERLPEEGEYVLCSQINGDVGEGKRLKHGWLIMYDSQEYGDYFVEAWMPLPETYKPLTRSQYRRMKEQRGEQE